jgi:hypothetical protein
MKSINETAKEYATQLNHGAAHDSGLYSGFIAGVNYAQKWIPAENELPENGNNVLIKIICQPHPPTKATVAKSQEPFTMITLGNYYKGLRDSWNIVHTLIVNGFHCKSWKVTHWRPIELK